MGFELTIFRFIQSQSIEIRHVNHYTTETYTLAVCYLTRRSAQPPIHRAAHAARAGMVSYRSSVTSLQCTGACIFPAAHVLRADTRAVVASAVERPAGIMTF